VESKEMGCRGKDTRMTEKKLRISGERKQIERRKYDKKM
jgi:hypothetical protein